MNWIYNQWYIKGTSEKLVKSHIMYSLCDNGVKVFANSRLFAANFALFSHKLYTICFIQSYSEVPKGNNNKCTC